MNDHRLFKIFYILYEVIQLHVIIYRAVLTIPIVSDSVLNSSYHDATIFKFEIIWIE